MHVAFVSTYPPQRCGIASYTRDLTAALATRDPSLVVGICAEHGASSSDAASVWPCFDGDGDYVGPILDRLDQLDVTVVHVQHEYGIFGVDERFHELLAGLRQRQRAVVVTMHTVHTALSFDLGCSWRQRRPPLDDLLVEQYQRRLGDGADVIIVHQERPIREVLLRQGVAPGHVRTIPHGTAIAPPSLRQAARAASGRAPGTSLVVAFGYFEPCKNHAVLIEALPLVRAVVPDVRLVLGAHVRHPLATTSEYRARCDRLVADLGMEAHVTFLDDPVPDEEVTTLLAGADVACFVYDEDTRSSSGALHRAVGCGVPVVAARIPKFAEVGEIADELLVNPRSPAEIARLLVRILSDADFRAYVRARGDRFAAATSWDRVARDHVSLYRDLAAKRGAHRQRVSRRRPRVPAPMS